MTLRRKNILVTKTHIPVLLIIGIFIKTKYYSKPKESKVNFKTEKEEKFVQPKQKKGSLRDLYDVGASQSKGDMNKYPLESIKESVQESIGKESTYKDSFGRSGENSSDLYKGTRNLTDSQKRASTKYDDDFEDQSMSMSRSTNVIDNGSKPKMNKFSNMNKNPNKNTGKKFLKFCLKI